MSTIVRNAVDGKPPIEAGEVDLLRMRAIYVVEWMGEERFVCARHRGAILGVMAALGMPLSTLGGYSGGGYCSNCVNEVGAFLERRVA